jgi:hypothetical protein
LLEIGFLLGGLWSMGSDCKRAPKAAAFARCLLGEAFITGMTGNNERFALRINAQGALHV